PRRLPRRALLRPLRSHPDRGLIPGPPVRARRPAHDRPPRPPGRPARAARAATAAHNRDRLPAPARARARAAAPPPDQLPRPRPRPAQPEGDVVSLAQLAPYYGFSRLPFSRRIAASALYRSSTHQDALARIGFLIAQEALGLLTGEVGSGKTVAARAAVAALDASRYTVIYLANP